VKTEGEVAAEYARDKARQREYESHLKKIYGGKEPP
jgi:hypothetical protein